jgi:hypothetical protein
MGWSPYRPRRSFLAIGCKVDQLIKAKADYPGDAVRDLLLHRGQELGMVKIQDYMDCMKDPKNRFRVGSFLPGDYECSPGDTGKLWPEKKVNVGTIAEANDAFEILVAEALADGWERYKV